MPHPLFNALLFKPLSRKFSCSFQVPHNFITLISWLIIRSAFPYQLVPSLSSHALLSSDVWYSTSFCITSPLAYVIYSHTWPTHVRWEKKSMASMFSLKTATLIQFFILQLPRKSLTNKISCHIFLKTS